MAPATFPAQEGAEALHHMNHAMDQYVLNLYHSYHIEINSDHSSKERKKGQEKGNSKRNKKKFHMGNLLSILEVDEANNVFTYFG